MINYTEILKEDLILLDFEDIFKNIEHSLLNDLLEYGLLKDHKVDLRKQDTKKLLYHHIIHEICECIVFFKKTHKKDVCIVFNKIFSDKSEICSYVDCEKLYTQIKKVLSTIEKMLFIPIQEINVKIYQNNLDRGEVIDIVKLISAKIKGLSGKPHKNLDKMKKFIKTYELVFLNDQYLSEVNSFYLMR